MIIGVAIKHGSIVICLPKPNRHNDCIKYAVKTLGIKPPIASLAGGQGFYTEEGVFLNRIDGYLHAEKNQQIVNPGTKYFLSSENLW